MKRLSIATALVLTIALLAGCGKTAAPTTPSTTKAAKDDKPVELTLMSGMGVRREALDEAIYAYTQKHPNVRIKVKEQQGPQMRTQDGKINTASFDGVDMVILPDREAKEAFSSGLLKDLSSVKLPQLNDLVAGLYDDLSKVDGKRFGLPIAISPALVMYNQEQLTKAGIKELPLDWTLQDFEQAMTATRSAGMENTLMLNMLAEPILRSYGGTFYDTAKQVWAFDTPEAKQGLAWIGKQIQSKNMKYEGAGNRIAIRIGGPNGPALMLLPNNLMAMPGMSVQPLPKGPKGRFSPANSTVLGVTASSANPEAAIDFIKETVGSSAGQIALAKGGIRPVMNDAKALAAWAEAVGDRVAQATEMALQGAYADAGTQIFNALNALDPYFQGTAGLDEAVSAAMAKLK